MTFAGTAAIIAFLWAAPAYAADAHGSSVTELLFPLINFLIFLYLLTRFGIPWIRDQLRSRSDRLLAAIEDAAEEKRRAESALRDYRERLQKCEEEALALSGTLRADGEKHKARLLSDAEALARKITADAEFQAEQEVKVAQHGLRKELAAAARSEAEKVIRRHLAPGDQARLVEDFLSQLGAQR